MTANTIFHALRRRCSRQSVPLPDKRARVSRDRNFMAALVVGSAIFASAANAEEQLELDGMAVFGNRELPKALFIVPWKDPETGMAPDRPINTLVNEALQPVDPEVFRRKLQYYEIVHRND